MDDSDFALAMMLQAEENDAREKDDAALAWSQNNSRHLLYCSLCVSLVFSLEVRLK